MLQSLLLAMDMVRVQMVALGQALAQCGANGTRFYWGALASWVLGGLWLILKIGWTVMPPSMRCATSPAD